MEIKRTLPLTYAIRENLEIVIALESNLKEVLKSSFWLRSIDIEDKITFLRAIGIAKSRLWDSVQAQYKEAKISVATVDRDGVHYTEGTASK